MIEETQATGLTGEFMPCDVADQVVQQPSAGWIPQWKVTKERRASTNWGSKSESAPSLPRVLSGPFH